MISHHHDISIYMLLCAHAYSSNSRYQASVALRYGLVGAANGTLVSPSTLIAQLVFLPLVPARVVRVVQQLPTELPGIRTGQPLVCGFVAAQLAIGRLWEWLITRRVLPESWKPSRYSVYLRLLVVLRVSQNALYGLKNNNMKIYIHTSGWSNTHRKLNTKALFPLFACLLSINSH